MPKYLKGAKIFIKLFTPHEQKQEVNINTKHQVLHALLEVTNALVFNLHTVSAASRMCGRGSLGKTNVVSKMNTNTTDSEINTDNT